MERSGLPSEPRVHRGDESLIAHAEVSVVHPTATSKQMESELKRLEMQITTGSLEVHLALSCRLLKGLHRRFSRGFVIGKRGIEILTLGEGVGQSDRVLHGKFGSRTNREMGGVSR